MPATIIDSRIFGDMFSDARMRQVWSDENRTAKYLDVERALAKVQGELGIIPAEAAAEIVKSCDINKIDFAKLKAKTEQVGYPIIAVVNQINALTRDRLGEYCHWGATTQDITDTATVLQIRTRAAVASRAGADAGRGGKRLRQDHRQRRAPERRRRQRGVRRKAANHPQKRPAGILCHRRKLRQRRRPGHAEGLAEQARRRPSPRRPAPLACPRPRAS